MTANEEAARAAEKARALDVYRPTGALIVHSHLDRRQEVIGVTRDDLEDVLAFDGMSAVFCGIGVFMLSGSVWLIVENALDVDGFAMDSLMSFCVASAVFGAGFLLAGGFFHARKRGRIRRIFDQTTPRAASTPPTGG